MLTAIVQGVRESAPEVAGLLAVVVVIAVLAWLGRRQEVRRAAARREVRATARRHPSGVLLVSTGWAARPEPGLPAAVDPWEATDPERQDQVLLELLDICPAGVR